MSDGRHGHGDGPAEVEVLITDRYLDSLLLLAPVDETHPGDDAGASVGAAVRAISRRLATDLPRFHPSFRFEERLALRLAQVGAAMRLPLAAGGDRQLATSTAGPAGAVAGPSAITRLPVAVANPQLLSGDETDRDSRPLLLGGAAVAASAISLAGAWLAWRRRTSPMARAARVAHSLRLPVGHG